MSEFLMLLSWTVMAVSLFFFATGSLGLLRFPDAVCRLHAVTKADTIGLGFLALAMALRADDWHVRILLLAVWLLAMASGATTCQILARYSRGGHFPAKHFPAKHVPGKHGVDGRND